MTRSSSLGALVACVIAPLMSLPAMAAPCGVAPVATYITSGFSCDVNGVVFSNITVTTSTSGNGAVALGSIQPITFMFNGSTENGLVLNYIASAGGGGLTGQADVFWHFDVAGNLLTDAVLGLQGNANGTGTFGVSETFLPNNATLSVQNSTQLVQVNFAPIASLTALKDDFTLVPTGTLGFSTSSAITNAFSTTSAVPLPGALPLFATGLAAMGLLKMRRKRKAIV